MVRRIEDAAAAYWKAGMRVIPLEEKQKRPLSTAWPSTVYDDEDAVRKAFASGVNLGVVLGDASGKLVDVDVDHAIGVAWAPQWLPRTDWMFSRNTTKSMHLLFRVSDNELPATQKFVLGSGKEARTLIEIRSTGAQTMFPPSLHPSGETVEWLSSGRNGGLEGGVDAAAVPGSVLQVRVAALAAAMGLALSWPVEGARHEAALAVCGGLARAGWEEEAINEFIRLVCVMAGETEKSIREDRLPTVRSTLAAMGVGRNVVGWNKATEVIDEAVVRKVCEWLGMGKARDGARTAGMIAEGGLELTEDGNSRVVVSAANGDLRYSTGVGWLAWDGALWRPEHELKVIARAAVVAREIGYAALNMPTESGLRKQMWRHAEKSLTQKSKEAVARGARSIEGVAVDVEALDADPWLFGVANGVLDLRTGELREARRADLMTRASPVPYVPGYRSPLWESFLESVTEGDKELIRFLQKAVGYSLTGSTREEKFFFVHGGAATGKSTFLAAMMTVMGPYGATANFETFLKRAGGGASGGGPRPDLARLRGARWVSSIEVDRGREFAEGLVKSIVGGDELTVRHMYKEEFTYVPTFKLWMSANVAPTIAAEDEGMWRRVLFVPFERVVPVEERDPNLKDAFRDVEGDVARAVLSWAVEGCAAWLSAGGLGVSRLVVEATGDKREEMDTLGQWMAEYIEPVPYDVTGEVLPRVEDRIEPGTLLLSYNGWLREHGYRDVSQRTFGERVAGRLPKARIAGKQWYYGCRLRRVGYDAGTGVIKFSPR